MSWHNRVLIVNLTEGTTRTEPLNTQWRDDYLGSRGLATKYLMEMMDPAADAMSPENVLIFATGPLTGTMASTGGRYAVVTCLLYTSPSPRDKRQSRMPSSA